jgi:hypothetical protein
VQFSQHPSLPRPRPPSLWTPDGSGQWREVQPFAGFIGGKPKTIALGLSHAFTPGDYRLRLSTNMEFYWDDVFFTVDEESFSGPLSGSGKGDGANAPEDLQSQQPQVHVHPLELTSADLHSRGFSQAVHRSAFAPEDYDYERVRRTPQWPPLCGFWTRFGDVKPLLAVRDDQLVVFGAGDEMTLSFSVPADPLPDGWVRDFVLYNVGWDKDANLNTLYGDSVEPLPFRAMQFYGDERPRDPEYDRYVREYQTRQQSRAEFWHYAERNPQDVMPRSRHER